MRALKIEHSITRRDEKSLEKYLSEIARHDVLTPEEEAQLFYRIQEGDERALSKIVLHNLRFVVSVAKQYQNTGLWLGDLINEGNIGLIKAARRFDVSRGFKFISYAVWWIRQSILQAINDKGRKIRIPSNQQAVSTKVQRAWNSFLQEFERKPSIAELAEATGFTEAKVRQSLANRQRCASIDAHIKEGEDTTLVQLLEDEETVSPDHELVVNESQQEMVRALLANLPANEATVLTLYYGIDQKHPLSLSDIGNHIGVSRERARQIKDKGLRKLRIRSRDLDPILS
jgi:RNA polymerase primary sigma factor